MKIGYFEHVMLVSHLSAHHGQCLKPLNCRCKHNKTFFPKRYFTFLCNETLSKRILKQLDYSQCCSKGNISGGARERRRHEALGGCRGMLPQKILKSRGLEMLNFQRFPRAICDLRISQIIYFVHCLSKPMHLESKTLVTLITK